MDFTEVCAEALRKAQPEYDISIKDDLELVITTAEGIKSTSFLHNAYTTYLQEPESIDEIIQQYSSVWLDAANDTSFTLDSKMIVPVIKERAWLKEIRESMDDLSDEEYQEQVHEDLNSELVIVYAQDSPESISYLTSKQLEQNGIDRSELRGLACSNLKRLLPEIDRIGTNGIYMYTAGGAYEASLLLFDSIWIKDASLVRGDPVLAVPSRDIVLLTGSEDAAGLVEMKQLVAEAAIDAIYPISQKLFVRRNGQFLEFTSDLEP